jgi:S-adenosylmethionine/arginine decarboxylase-like enzyme
MLRSLRPSGARDVSKGRGVGAHCIVDLWGANHLTDAKVLTTVLETASNAAGASLLKIFLHEFPSSGGITGVALLAESHMSIHTWPEKELCGDRHLHVRPRGSKASPGCTHSAT